MWVKLIFSIEYYTIDLFFEESEADVVCPTLDILFRVWRDFWVWFLLVESYDILNCILEIRQKLNAASSD